MSLPLQFDMTDCPWCDSPMFYGECALGALGDRLHCRCPRCHGEWSVSVAQEREDA